MDLPSPKMNPRSPVHFVVTWRIAAGVSRPIRFAFPPIVRDRRLTEQHFRAHLCALIVGEIVDRMNGIIRIGLKSCPSCHPVRDFDRATIWRVKLLAHRRAQLWRQKENQPRTIYKNQPCRCIHSLVIPSRESCRQKAVR